MTEFKRNYMDTIYNQQVENVTNVII